MQGSQSSAAVLPEILIFDNDSISTESGMSSPSPWNTLPIPVQNQLPSGETHSQYLQQNARRNIRTSDWYLGETSSIVHPLSIHSNGTFLLPNSSDPNAASNPRDLENISEFEDQEDDDDEEDDDEDDDDDDCRVIGSSNNGITINGIADMPGSSSNGQRASCKRKALEFQAGPSSGSSSFFQNTERRQWNSIPEQVNNSITNNAPEQANNGLRLGVGNAFSPNNLSANEDISRRNFRLRIHGLRQQDSILPENPFSSDPTEVRNVDLLPSPRHSLRSSLRNRSPELNPSTLVENGSVHGQSTLLEVQNPTVRRIHHSRWSGSPSARISRSSNSTPIFEETTPRTIPGQVLENPMLVSSGETGNGSSSPNPMNWNFSGVGGDINNNNNNNLNNNSIADTTVAGNATSASRTAFVRGEGSSAAGGSRRSLPHYQRRLSEIVRRSLLLSERNASNNVTQSPEMESPNEPNNDNNVGHQVPISELGASGAPFSWRSLVAAATGEGSSSVMSEQIRHVLDLMRRGEGLRIEDVMILDHSVFFGMEDVPDQHQDMRLDVDNMSYEELLALEERIGDVCTGLTEETIMKLMKQWKFSGSEEGNDQIQIETEPCSICREDYVKGEDLGALECGHDFHRDCIKQWLVQKNVCPICKTTGLNA